MTELRFVGTDMRWLYETLIEACDITWREGVCPAVIVNGKRYEPFDLIKVAQLLPDESLQPHHQVAADQMFKKSQSGYRRTGSNLAHRANQYAADARARAFLLSRNVSRDRPRAN